jgi:hypothetical protein
MDMGSTTYFVEPLFQETAFTPLSQRSLFEVCDVLIDAKGDLFERVLFGDTRPGSPMSTLGDVCSSSCELSVGLTIQVW